MRIQLHPEATAELASAQDFYNARLPGLGAELEDAVDAAPSMIAAMPQAGEHWPGIEDVRVFYLNRFPFGLPYSHDETRIVLLAIARAKRRPGYWRDRVHDV